MKRPKKIGSLLLAAVMILSLAACGSNSTGNNSDNNDVPAQAPSGDTSAPAETPEDAAATGGKVLVVYYSTNGNTRRVAEDIAEAAGGDLFGITPHGAVHLRRSGLDGR